MSSEFVIIILDTNVWSYLLRLFDHLISKNKNATYRMIWKKLENENKYSDSTDEAFEKYMNEMFQFQGRFRQGIVATKRILNLITMKNVKIVIPIYIYNECEKSLSSKISTKKLQTEMSKTNKKWNYDQFFLEMPIKTEFGFEKSDELISGEDYPCNIKKCDNSKDIDKKIVLRKFFEKIQNENYIRHNILKKFINKLNHETNGKIHHCDEKKWCDKIKEKYKCWDKYLIVTLRMNGFENYITRTKQLVSVVETINSYRKSPIQYVKNVIECLLSRLTKNKEEFDFFDLCIYLYAKEIGAHIMTFNTQAFQEIQDPIFLDYFSDIKILHPSINYKTNADLEQSFKFIDILKMAIENDFKDEFVVLNSMKTIAISHDKKLIEFVDILNKYIQNIDGNLDSAPIFDAIQKLKRPLHQITNTRHN